MAAPTWYDVLGVDRDASPEQIRAAWREATDRVEPGSGQFRAYNEAAETLLDPERRAAYDAGLAPAPTPAAAPAPPRDVPPPPPPSQAREDETHDKPQAGHSGRRGRRLAPRLLAAPVAVLVVLLVLSAAATAYAVAGLRDVRATEAVDRAAEQAPVAAEQAAEAMLSYDYRQLPADQARAEGFLTGEFKTEFAENFALLAEQADGSEGPAVQTEAVVTAQSVGSGLVDVSADGRTARVLVFVNQTTEKADQDPQVFLNRVAMTLVERDGRWLVSDLRSY